MERNTGKELYGELQLSTCHQSNHGTGREQSAVESEGKAEVVVGILGRLMERLFELNLRANNLHLIMKMKSINGITSLSRRPLSSSSLGPPGKSVFLFCPRVGERDSVFPITKTISTEVPSKLTAPL